MGLFERHSSRLSRSAPDVAGIVHRPGPEQQPAATHSSSADSSHAGPAGTADGRPRITRIQAGHYVIVDGRGRQVGTIRGDYVIGFTVTCGDSQRRFRDLEQARAAIAADAEATYMAQLPAVS